MLAAVCFVIAAVAAVSVYLVCVGATSPVAYAVYGVAAVLFGYGVYIAAGIVKENKAKIVELLKRDKRIARIIDDYGAKTLFFSVGSCAITTAFATINLVSAIMYGLTWYYAISAYYFILAGLRGGVTISAGKAKRKYGEETAGYEKIAWQTYLSAGVVLTALEMAMAVAVTEMILSKRPVKYGEIMTITNAAYTFVKIATAVNNLVKAKRYQKPIVQALRNINFADACMSTVSLTVIMLATFGDEGSLILIKAIVGFAACAAIIVLAAVMTVRGAKRLKRIKTANYEHRQEQEIQS